MFFLSCAKYGWLFLQEYSLSCNSEFEELEAVPTSSVIEGPLEPTTSSIAAPIPDVPDDPFANFFSVRYLLSSILHHTVSEKFMSAATKCSFSE